MRRQPHVDQLAEPAGIFADALTRLHGLFDTSEDAPTAAESGYKPGSGDQEG
jgi:hypothetical protein